MHLTREHDLEDVADADVLLGASHRIAEGGPVAEARERSGRPRGPTAAARQGTSRGQVLLECLQDLLAAIERRALAGLDVRYQHESLQHVIEGDDRSVEGEGGDRDPGRLVAIRDALEEADGIVAQVAHCAAREARQALDLYVRSSQALAERGERRLGDQTCALAISDHDAFAAHLEAGHRVATEERVARDALAADHALE